MISRDPADRIIRQRYEKSVILTLPDHAYPMVRFVVAHRYGAVLDTPQTAGGMRLMGEALLRGTRQRSRLAFGRALDALGASLDTAVGQELFLLRGSCLRRHLEATWALSSEALCDPAFAEQQIAALRDEAGEALGLERDDDDSVADLFLRQALFGGHPLAHPAAGTQATVRDLGPQQMWACYRRLASDNLIFAFAGDVTAEKSRALVAQLCAALPALAAPSVPPLAPVKPAGRARLIIVDKPQRTQVQLRLATLGPVGQQAPTEAFWLGAQAFGGTFTSPYTRQVRDVRGWSYFAQADYPRHARFAAPLVLRCAPALPDAVPALQLSLQMLQAVSQGLVDVADIERTRAYLLGRYPFEVATAYDMLGAALAYEARGLSPLSLFEFPEKLAALPSSAVHCALRSELNFAGHVAVLVAPQAAARAALQEAQLADQVEVLDFREGLL